MTIRYHMDADRGGTVESSDGEWVMWADHEEVLAKLELLRIAACDVLEIEGKRSPEYVRIRPSRLEMLRHLVDSTAQEKL